MKAKKQFVWLFICSLLIGFKLMSHAQQTKPFSLPETAEVIALREKALEYLEDPQKTFDLVMENTNSRNSRLLALIYLEQLEKTEKALLDQGQGAIAGTKYSLLQWAFGFSHANASYEIEDENNPTQETEEAKLQKVAQVKKIQETANFAMQNFLESKDALPQTPALLMSDAMVTYPFILDLPTNVKARNEINRKIRKATELAPNWAFGQLNKADLLMSQVPFVEGKELKSMAAEALLGYQKAETLNPNLHNSTLLGRFTLYDITGDDASALKILDELEKLPSPKSEQESYKQWRKSISDKSPKK